MSDSSVAARMRRYRARSREKAARRAYALARTLKALDRLFSPSAPRSALIFARAWARLAAGVR